MRRLLSDIWLHLQHDAVAGALKLAIVESGRFPQIVETWLRGLLGSAHASIVEVARQGIDRGEFRRMDPDVVAHSLLLPMLLCCLQRHVMGEGTRADCCLDETFVPQHVELILRGLCRDLTTKSRGRSNALSTLARAPAASGGSNTHRHSEVR